MKRVAILISGGGSNMVRLVESMTGDHPARAVLVGSNDPGAGGLARAEALGVPTFAVDHRAYKGDRTAFEAALLEPLLRAQPDILCLAGFMRILTADFVRRFEGRMLNIHPSLLPKYPGLHTHRQVLDNGDEEHGTSVHFVTDELDGGPVILQAKVPVFAGDSEEEITARVQAQEHAIYPLVISWFVDGRLRMAGNHAWLDERQLPPQGYAADE